MTMLDGINPRLDQVRSIRLNAEQQKFDGNLLKFRLGQHSHLTLQPQTGALDLIQDFNRNGRLDRGEIVARTRRDRPLTLANAKPGRYVVHLKSAEVTTSPSVVAAATPIKQPQGRTQAPSVTARAIASNRWGAKFLNRNNRTLTRYRNFDFSRPNAELDLGGQGASGDTVARLNVNFGTGSPKGVNRNYFAMQGTTSVRLQEGLFYKLSSQSDDGTRVWFTDRQGKTLAELNDNWKNRSTRDPAWSRILKANQSGAVGFNLHYFERKGAAVVDVKLERYRPTGEILASAVNLRSQASTLNNAPIDLLTSGELVQVVRQVRSPNDTTYRNWYEVVTSDGQTGYIAADNTLVSVEGGSNVVAVGNPLPDDPTTNPPIPGGGGGSGSATISPRVWITSDDKIAIRSDKSAAGSEITRLGANTAITVLEKTTGGSYLNGYDQWYRIRFNQGGQQREGYVAAYYVDLNGTAGTFQTAISKDSRLYKPHFDEVVTPTYYSKSYRPTIEQAAAGYSWLKPSVIAGIGSRESAWGRLLSPPGPGGTGDGGHGRGIMQIDDRYHQTFINSGRWSNPVDNIAYAIDQVLAKNYDYLSRNTALKGTELLRGALAAYNSGLTNVMNAIAQGRDVDYFTTGQDYSWDVLNRAGWFQLNGFD